MGASSGWWFFGTFPLLFSVSTTCLFLANRCKLTLEFLTSKEQFTALCRPLSLHQPIINLVQVVTALQTPAFMVSQPCQRAAYQAQRLACACGRLKDSHLF